MQTLRCVLSDSKVPTDGVRRYLYDIWQPLTLLVLTASFTVAFFANYDPKASASENEHPFFCTADGNVEKRGSDYRPFWDPQLYFTVNVAFGNFPFSVAKIIDAAWDIVIGRGGQFFAAMLAYQTLRRSLTVIMETCTVTIPAVFSVYCQQVQPGSVRQLIHTMFWHWGSVHTI